MAQVPDFGALASQQSGVNNAATTATNYANRVNQTNALGTINWQQNPDGTWAQQTAPHGQVQDLFNSSISGQQGLAGVIGGGVNYGNLPSMPDSGFGASQQVIDAWNALQQPGLQKAGDAARARAAAMGITIGSNANDDIERTIGTNEATSRNQGILAGTQEYQNVFNRGLAARQQGVSEANGLYDRAISGSGALTSMRESLNPNKWATNVPASAAYVPENIYGAALDTFSANQANENRSQAQSNANRAATTGAITSGISALGGIGGIFGAGKDLWNWASGSGGGNAAPSGYNNWDQYNYGMGSGGSDGLSGLINMNGGWGTT